MGGGGRRRGAAANSPCHAYKVRNSVHLPAANARSVPKTLAVGGAAAPRRRHAVRIRTANSPCEFAVRIMANSVHLPAADARSVPKTLAVGGAAAPRRRGAGTQCEFALRAGARRANSPNSLCELWHAVRIYTVAL